MSSVSEKIIEELAEKDFIVFAGSGVDSSTEIPNWQKLLGELVAIAENMGFEENVKVSSENQEEFPVIAQKIYNYLVRIGKEEVYFEKIKELITPKKIPYGTEHLEIAKTTNWIITTNFSEMFEEAFRSKFEVQSEVQSKKTEKEKIKPESLPVFSFESHFETPTIVYLHGKADEEFIIFREDDYKKYYPSVSGCKGAKDVEEYLKYVYKNYTIVFVGFGFERHIIETFIKIYKEIEMSDIIGSEKQNYNSRLKKIKHYCFLKKPNTERDQKLVSTLKKLNIEVIETVQHRDWIECFQKIREVRRKSKLVEVGNDEI